VQRLGPILGLVLALALPGAAAGTTTKTVRIKDIDFSPKTLVIHRGDAVTWRFLDAGTPHDVTSRGATRFRSSPIKQSGSYTVRFTRAGTYRYVCTIHFTMAAKVVVR
jgi:plastocyanin